MSNRAHMQPYLSNSLPIRQEIQRFESVHPSIYAIYDLIEAIPDPLLQQQIREHVVCIEDSFVNSQEWTLSRTVPDVKLGIVGSLSSGKSALVHRYLTGSYMQEESPEGGRFKKEVVIDGQSYLLLIRDEGGPPELQFTAWVDAVIFVFSLENEASFNAVYTYYAKMAHYRNTADMPMILVGTQDAISENNPRVIDDSRARKLASDLKHCSYYETCATYGLNVERVFQDACAKVVQTRATATPTNSRPTTPSHSLRNLYISSPTNNDFPNSHSGSSGGSTNLTNVGPSGSTHNLASGLAAHQAAMFKEPFPREKGSGELVVKDPATKELITPSSTPTTSRKNRRRSNIFTPSKKEDKDDKKAKNGDMMGSGRAIPVKQGYLYKRSKAINKEWKKKYATLSDDGNLTYHPSLHDYMDNVHGKEINLLKTTVKIPGQKPRGSQGVKPATNPNISASTGNGLASEVQKLSLSSMLSKKQGTDKESLLTAYDIVRDGALLRSGSVSSNCEDAVIISNSGVKGFSLAAPQVPAKIETPNLKKRHRRIKSSGAKNPDNADDSDGYEFIIVSIDNKQWHFEAASREERDQWVQAIEQQILNCLQSVDSNRIKSRNTHGDASAIDAIRKVRGNQFCVDCDVAGPDWASLNLGALMCIECSGIHRNLGTHVSRVRSLDLDDWPSELVKVMLSIGNTMANSVWEGNKQRNVKPAPQCSREEKEKWIRAKYEQKEFLPGPPLSNVPVGQQLLEAVCKGDLRNVILLLAHAAPDQVNTRVGSRDRRTPLHLSCALGNVVITQLLIWYGANVAAVDQEGRNPLVYAKNSGSSECVNILVNNGCPENGGDNTLPRRKSLTRNDSDVFDKLPASVI